MSQATPNTSAKDLEVLYNVRFSSSDLQKKNAIWEVLCGTFFQRYISPNDTVLDIACGMGEFLNNIKASQKMGVDLNPQSASALAPGTVFHNCSAENMSHIESDSVDVAFASNFFEHLPSKAHLDRVLLEVKRVLKPGGRFLMMQPNIRFTYNVYWDFYDHHLALSDRSMTEGLQINGFEVEKVIPKFLPYSTKSPLPKAPILVWAYIKLPITWHILGKQFFICARKRA